MNLPSNISGGLACHQSNTRRDHTPLRISESNTLGQSRQATTDSPEASITSHPRPNSGHQRQDDQRNLIGDIICFVLLTPLATISAYLCATGARTYLKDKWSEAVGLICLSVFLALVYLFWVLLTVRYHWQVWRLWQDNNQDIRLVETERPGMHRPPSAETVVSEVDLGSRDASINMPMDHDHNKGSQTSISSASALLNDQMNGYSRGSAPATLNCGRESTQMSAPVCNELDYKYNMDTPNDSSCENQSSGDFTIDQDTLALKDAEQSRRNSELTSISLHDSSLLGVASSYETVATASSILQDGPTASSTPGNVEMNRNRPISTCIPRQASSNVLNPPNQYLHPINTFIPQRTASQPNLAHSDMYTVFSNPPSPEELRNNSSKHLKQNLTQLRGTDSFSESETLPPYPSMEFIDVPRTSLVSLPLLTPVPDSDMHPDSPVVHRQLQIGDIQSTPILDNERPPNPPLSPNITIESPKSSYSYAETTETRPGLVRNPASAKLPSSTACVSTEIKVHSEAL